MSCARRASKSSFWSPFCRLSVSRTSWACAGVGVVYLVRHAMVENVYMLLSFIPWVYLRSCDKQIQRVKYNQIHVQVLVSVSHGLSRLKEV